jgi:hypothetical protein
MHEAPWPCHAVSLEAVPVVEAVGSFSAGAFGVALGID